ncbi:HPr family phosphocarrier protein [Fusibacter ferrireducens]|uniref:HPr family phosphocarrier protein n=1 Tax=Fusibacter ferrireducens TaxID=2785058 RepID=A0ABR9ZWA8_9FIRM|nr:HPr family phosphocarrier protein [Fusibacter ferrireducens]MBF4694736.1 HPr family phosphocarrier protein [Fusibacter ferrireducens]
METKVKIINEAGFHARPVSKWLQIVKMYEAEVVVGLGDKEVNGGSMLAMMTLGAKQGDELEIKVSGKDEKKVLEALVDFVNQGMGEAV